MMHVTKLVALMLALDTISTTSANFLSDFLHGKNTTTSTEHVQRNLQDDELVEFPCSADLKPFPSYIEVQFDGQEKLLSKHEKLYLEQGFIRAYAETMCGRCDLYQRTLNKGNLNVQPPRPSYRQATSAAGGTGSAVTPGQSFYDVAGSCRGCATTDSGSFNAFNNAFRRRGLQEKRRPCQRKQRSLKTVEWYDDDYVPEKEEKMDICTCPAGSFPVNEETGLPELEPDTPTLEEFQEAYNVIIQSYIRQGLVENITSVLNLIEVENNPDGAPTTK